MTCIPSARRRLARLLTLVLGLALPLSSVAQAGLSYQYLVTVDTSGVSGASGYIDFQFNPADPGSTPAATATVSQLAGFSAIGRSPTLDGAATGTPTSSLVLNNTSAVNSSYSTVSFGSSLSFLLTLTGPAFTETATNGSTFLFGLYDATQQPLNGSDPMVAQIDLMPFGVSPGVELNITTGAAFSGGPNAQVTAVPEASTTVMLGLLALAGVVAARRGRRQAA